MARYVHNIMSKFPLTRCSLIVEAFDVFQTLIFLPFIIFWITRINFITNSDNYLTGLVFPFFFSSVNLFIGPKIVRVYSKKSFSFAKVCYIFV